MTRRAEPQPGPVAADPALGRPPEGEPGAPPLLLPGVPFPPYRFVPGLNPHPFVHSNGYLHGAPRSRAVPVEGGSWRSNPDYLRGLDFFNRGWWWEAHEAWEDLWHVMDGRDAAWRAFLKGLIQLAACALNRERGSDAGAERLLHSACGCLEEAEGLVRQRAGEPAAAGPPRAGGPSGALALGGLALEPLRAAARQRLGRPVQRVRGFWLVPA